MKGSGRKGGSEDEERKGGVRNKWRRKKIRMRKRKGEDEKEKKGRKVGEFEIQYFDVYCFGNTHESCILVDIF